jgi:hypothetical protein
MMTWLGLLNKLWTGKASDTLSFEASETSRKQRPLPTQKKTTSTDAAKDSNTYTFQGYGHANSFPKGGRHTYMHALFVCPNNNYWKKGKVKRVC